MGVNNGNSAGDMRKSRQIKSKIDPMTRNYKTLMKMNNTAVPSTKNEPDKNNILRNVFTDYTAGCNMSEYKDLLWNRQIGNGTVQWVLRLRQKFEDSLKRHGKVDISSKSSFANHNRYGNPPSWYYASKFYQIKWKFKLLLFRWR